MLFINKHTFQSSNNLKIINENDNMRILSCKYDNLKDYGHNLLVCKNKKVMYYNAVTKNVLEFTDVYIQSSCLFCKDDKYQYILYGEEGTVIYKKEYTSYSESYYFYCGNTDKGPVFYDVRYSTYLYPCEEGYKIYKDLFNFPIIVNGKNTVNITEGENGVGVIDSYGNCIMDNRYDSIEIELKVTAKKGKKSENKIIPFSKNRFRKGEMSDVIDWI